MPKTKKQIKNLRARLDDSNEVVRSAALRDLISMYDTPEWDRKTMKNAMKGVVKALKDPSQRIQNMSTSHMQEYGYDSPDPKKAVKNLTKLLTKPFTKDSLFSTHDAVSALGLLGEAAVKPEVVKGLIRAYQFLFAQVQTAMAQKGYIEDEEDYEGLADLLDVGEETFQTFNRTISTEQ
jgi:HEAT repeat protein